MSHQADRGRVLQFAMELIDAFNLALERMTVAIAHSPEPDATLLRTEQLEIEVRLDHLHAVVLVMTASSGQVHINEAALADRRAALERIRTALREHHAGTDVRHLAAELLALQTQTIEGGRLGALLGGGSQRWP